MATWRLADIESAYWRGERLGASHMIVAFDRVHGDNYPIYVMPGEDPHSKVPTDSGIGVDECYRYSLGWAVQSVERRAQHWEWEPRVKFTVVHDGVVVDEDGLTARLVNPRVVGEPG